MVSSQTWLSEVRRSFKFHRHILYDEKAYPEPTSFRPERFLGPDGNINPDIQDPMLASFGFGRRYVWVFLF